MKSTIINLWKNCGLPIFLFMLACTISGFLTNYFLNGQQILQSLAVAGIVPVFSFSIFFIQDVRRNGE